MEKLKQTFWPTQYFYSLHKLIYNGGSVVFSPKGEPLASVPDGEEGIETVSLSLISLQQLRDKFPVWKDADAFRL